MQKGLVGIACTNSARDFFRKWFWDPPNHTYWAPKGASMLLEQEGIPFRKIPDQDLENEEVLKQLSIVVIADQPSLTEKQEKALRAAHQKGVGLIVDGVTGWIDPKKSVFRRMEMGLRPAPQLADLQGVTDISYDLSYGTHHFRLLNCNHMMTSMLENPEEQKFPIKYMPAMKVEGLAPEAVALAELHGSTEQIGSTALIAHDDGLARVVTFTFPAARWAIFKSNAPLHPERDLDLLNYPMDCSTDSLRMMLAGAVQWSSQSQVLAKKYYWRAEGGVIPKSVVCTSSDLCGGTKRGVEAINKLFASFGARHTYMDVPWGLYMNRENIGAHDVALHEHDSTDLITLREGRKWLQEATGRPVKGWARHGSTKLLNYPSIWQKAADAGFQWTRHMYVQTPLEAAKAVYLRELESPGNRLPYRPYNPCYGRFEDILEIPIFDTTDDLDRLLIEYGHKYSWNEWQAVVRKRLKIHMDNHTICSYQIHGWVAGAAAEEPMEERGWRAVPGWRDAAKDCFAMLRFFLEYACQNTLPVKTATEINDWWRTRTYGVEILSTEISKGDVTVKIFNKTNRTVYGFVLQVSLPQGARVRVASVNGRNTGDFELWTENSYDKIMIPLDLQPGTSTVKLNINFP